MYVGFARASGAANADAQLNLGLMYDKRQDYAEAVRWYRKAVKRGHAGAKEALREAERLAREWTAKHKR